MSEIGNACEKKKHFISFETDTSGTITIEESTKTNEVLSEVEHGYENIVEICYYSRKV